MKERLLAAAGPLLGITLFALAFAVLHHELAAYDYQDVLGRLGEIPANQIAIGILLMAAGYFSLTGYDALAFYWIRNPLAYRRIALASFVAYVFSHNVGLSFLGGSAVRYRMFSSWGVKPGELARAIPFNMITFWLGFLSLGGVVSVAAPLRLPGEWHPLIATSRPLGIVLLTLLAVYVAQSLRRERVLHIWGIEVELPGPGLAAAQIAISSLDWTLAAAVFYALLPAAPGLAFVYVLGAYLLSQVVGVVSHVPGGLGVFETMMVLLLAPWLPGDAVLASALAYRLVYYLLPLAIAVFLFAGFELRARRELWRRARGAFTEWGPELVPRVLTLTIFVSGVVLLFSGATPAAAGRIERIARLLPMPALEMSHFLASFVGVALLLLARALQQRVEAGHALTLGMLAAGAIFSLLKGLDWEEAAFLVAVFLMLLPCRRFFYRRSSLLSLSFTPGWVASILLALISTGFLLLLVYRHVEYAHELWWQFEIDANAPRSLRALVGGAGLLAVVGLWRVLRVAPAIPLVPTPAALERAVPIVRGSTRSLAHLALLGDKQLLFDESGAGFVMYGVSGHSWVSMGDPVGPPDLRRELAWRFHELADVHGGLTVFYEVGGEDLPIYLDLGLSLRKLGEEGRVHVPEFSLDGSVRKGLRQTQRRMEREGATVEVLAPEAVPSMLDELGAISDAWLREKSTREKRFSLGRFDRTYLCRTPVAVVRQGGRIVAFANVWAPDARDEFSVDLMRYDDRAPSGVMEFLFTELLLWGQRQGYEWFSLGMAPLSGFEHHRLAPLWNRLGALLFRHGENFYHFRGLRDFKEKFDPVWEPRYLASPGGLTLPIVLTQISTLISGGVTGVVRK
jgi:phosphatidylglycerol lysyltransferase